jgi:ADP-ribosylglycohydrolase
MDRTTDDRDRAAGALYGRAIGDALGMPTQMLSRETVARLYPTLAGFVPGSPANAISRGQPPGRVTDDTEQALILADVLLESGGRVDARPFADRLLKWAEHAEADGSDQPCAAASRLKKPGGMVTPTEQPCGSPRWEWL